MCRPGRQGRRLSNANDWIRAGAPDHIQHALKLVPNQKFQEKAIKKIPTEKPFLITKSSRIRDHCAVVDNRSLRSLP